MDGTLNAALRAARIDKGLTIEQAADQIKVGREVLRRAESNGSRPQPRHAIKIAEFYGLKPSELWPIEGPVTVVSKDPA